MTEKTINPLIREAVNTVLETMFFSAPLGPAAVETGDAVLEARLGFRGHRGGMFLLSVSAPGARLLAADFLGEAPETLADSAPGQVVCEMANMICGKLLSQLESGPTFLLETPELVAPGTGHVPLASAPGAIQQSFQLETGILSVTLHFGLPA